MLQLNDDSLPSVLKAFDVNNDGRLSTGELLMAAQALKKSREQASNLKKAMVISSGLLCLIFGLVLAGNEASKEVLVQDHLMVDRTGAPAVTVSRDEEHVAVLDAMLGLSDEDLAHVRTVRFKDGDNFFTGHVSLAQKGPDGVTFYLQPNPLFAAVGVDLVDGEAKPFVAVHGTEGDQNTPQEGARRLYGTYYRGYGTSYVRVYWSYTSPYDFTATYSRGVSDWAPRR